MSGFISRRKFVTGSLCLGCAACSGQALNSRQTLDVIAFPGGFNLPIWVAEASGYFADEGLAVTLHFTPDSVFQIRGLLNGDYDIAMTALDNVIAYREGQGAFSHPRQEDIAAFLASDDGFLSLVAQSQFETVSDLRGETLAVDALTTGYAFVLFEILSQAGIYQEVEFASFGGVANRWETLQRNEHAGTMLVTPFDLFAQGAGFNRLATTGDTLGAYQGVVAAALRDPDAATARNLRGFSRAYVRALQWMADAGNSEGVAALLAEQLQIDNAGLVQAITGALLRPGGFSQTGEFSQAGFDTVLDLRRRYAGGIGPDAALERYTLKL